MSMSINNSFGQNAIQKSFGSQQGVEVGGKNGGQQNVGLGMDLSEIDNNLDGGQMSGADLIRKAKVQPDKDGGIFLKDAEVVSSKDAVKTEMMTTDSLTALAEGERNAGKALGSWLGRKFMGLVHVVKSFVTFDVFMPSWQSNNVKNYSKKVAENTKDVKLEKDFAAPANEKVAFNATFVALSSGFKVKKDSLVTIKSFPTYVQKPTKKNPDKGTTLYPNKSGKPQLRDIVQDPALQDCWFLSSIAAVLSTKGPDAITRLITWDGKSENCKVRLGNKELTVPMGEVKYNGSSCVSKSAPWVKILEQAAAMYLASEKTVSNMQRGSALTGLGMLLVDQQKEKVEMADGEQVEKDLFLSSSEKWPSLDLIIKARAENVPVVLGHVGGDGLTVRDRIAGVMRDNISPGHAITVLDVHVRKTDADGNPTKAWLTVMDPYGRTRIISSSALTRCMGYFGTTPGKLTEFKEILGENYDIQSEDWQ